MYVGSLLELHDGQLLVAASAMQNVHVFDKELSVDARALPLPKPHGTFTSMSLIPSQSRDLIACSFCSPNSIYIHVLQQNALEQLQSIAVDFKPFRSVWLPTLKTLLVFDLEKSKSVTSVCIDRGSERVRKVEMNEAIDVYSSCVLKRNEKVRIESVIMFDFITKSLREFDVI